MKPLITIQFPKLPDRVRKSAQIIAETMLVIAQSIGRGEGHGRVSHRSGDVEWTIHTDITFTEIARLVKRDEKERSRGS